MRERTKGKLPDDAPNLIQPVQAVIWVLFINIWNMQLSTLGTFYFIVFIGHKS